MIKRARNNKILGIDIDGESVKIVELEPISGNVKINPLGSAKIPRDTIKEDIVANPEVLVKAIRSLITKNNTQTKTAIVSIRSPNTLLRLVRLPFMNDAEIRLALQREINKYTAFRNKETTFDMHVVEEISEEGVRKINVLYTAATKALCDSYLKIIEDAGLEPVAIDISQLSILRNLYRTHPGISGLEAIMVVETNSTSIDMCIIKGDKIRFCHTVRLNPDTITGENEAFLDKITSVIKLVLNFYQAKYKGGEKVSKIIFTCDSYPHLSSKEKWEERLPMIPVEMGDSPGELSPFTCAIGSALHSKNLSSYPVRFNLIPKEKFERSEFIKLIHLLSTILGALLAIFFILGGGIFANNEISRREIRKIEKQLKDPHSLQAKLSSILEARYKTEKRLKDRLMFVNKMSSRTIMWDRVLVSALAKVPKGLWVISITGKGENVEIKGRAYSEEPIFKFIGSLDDSFYLSEARLISSQDIKSASETEEIEFIIVCDLKRVK